MTSTNCICWIPLTSAFWLESVSGKPWQEIQGQEKGEDRAFSPHLPHYFLLFDAVVLAMPPSLNYSSCKLAFLYGSSSH